MRGWNLCACRWWRCCWYLVVQQQQLWVIWVNMGNQRLIGLLFATSWGSSATKSWYLLCCLTLLSFATWHLIFYLCTNSCLKQLSELWAEKTRGWPGRCVSLSYKMINSPLISGLGCLSLSYMMKEGWGRADYRCLSFLCLSVNGSYSTAAEHTFY